MKKLLLFIFLLSPLFAPAQQAQNKAAVLCAKALSYRITGAYGEAARLLTEAIKLDTTVSRYSYELSYTLLLMDRAAEALREIKAAVNKNGTGDSTYHLFAQLCFMNGDSVASMLALNEGLARFPASGRLFHFKGLLCSKENQLERAAACFDQGIAAEPGYAINYYDAAKLSLASSEKQWGMVYAEIFLLLDHSTTDGKREDMRQLLYKAYSSSIALDAGGQLQINCCNRAAGSFCAAFSKALGAAVPKNTVINLTSLAQIRTAFIGHYFTQKANENFPNPLFDYEKKMKEAGLLEAYHYWLLGAADKERFINWIDLHGEEFGKVQAWMALHPLQLDQQNCFVRKP